jgi:exodeoxyribonuclease VII large subunit
MNRGYSIVEKNNDLIKSIKELKENDKIEIKLKDGSMDCIIEKIKVKEVE